MAVWALSKLSKESFELEKNKTLQEKNLMGSYKRVE